MTADVYDVVVDARGYLRWWPQVYLEVTVVKPAGEPGLGGAFDLHTRGKLPYTLPWQARVSETNYPDGFTTKPEGKRRRLLIRSFAGYDHLRKNHAVY